MFATIKIQWTLSSEEKHKNILRFCQDTIMSRHDVQTELTRYLSCLNKGLLNFFRQDSNREMMAFTPEHNV